MLVPMLSCVSAGVGESCGQAWSSPDAAPRTRLKAICSWQCRPMTLIQALSNRLALCPERQADPNRGRLTQLGTRLRKVVGAGM